VAWIDSTLALLHQPTLDMDVMARQMAEAAKAGVSSSHPVLQRLHRRICNQQNWAKEAEYLLSSPTVPHAHIGKHLESAARYHIGPQAPMFKRLQLRELNHSLVPVMRAEAEKLQCVPLTFLTLPLYKEQVEAFAFEADYFEMPSDIVKAAELLVGRLKTAEACACLSKVLLPAQGAVAAL
jgi:hypothetical protein